MKHVLSEVYASLLQGSEEVLTTCMGDCAICDSY